MDLPKKRGMMLGGLGLTLILILISRYHKSPTVIQSKKDAAPKSGLSDLKWEPVKAAIQFIVTGMGEWLKHAINWQVLFDFWQCLCISIAIFLINLASKFDLTITILYLSIIANIWFFIKIIIGRIKQK